MTNERLSLHAVLKGHQGKTGIHPPTIEQTASGRLGWQSDRKRYQEAGDDQVQARKNLLETLCSWAPLDENRKSCALPPSTSRAGALKATRQLLVATLLN